jgi:hypothetical protein
MVLRAIGLAGVVAHVLREALGTTGLSDDAVAGAAIIGAGVIAVLLR